MSSPCFRPFSTENLENYMVGTQQLKTSKLYSTVSSPCFRAAGAWYLNVNMISLTCNFLMLLVVLQIYLLKNQNDKMNKSVLCKREQFWNKGPKQSFHRTSKLWKLIRNFHHPIPIDLEDKKIQLNLSSYSRENFKRLVWNLTTPH